MLPPRLEWGKCFYCGLLCAPFWMPEALLPSLSKPLFLISAEILICPTPGWKQFNSKAFPSLLQLTIFILSEASKKFTYWFWLTDCITHITHVHRDFGLPPPALYGNTLDLSLPAEPKWAPWLVEAHIAFPTFFSWWLIVLAPWACYWRLQGQKELWR